MVLAFPATAPRPVALPRPTLPGITAPFPPRLAPRDPGFWLWFAPRLAERAANDDQARP